MEKQKNFDICVFGGCSLDATYFQQEDLTYNNQPDLVEPGGKGANQAVAAARAGAKVVMLTRLGDDNVGQLIKQNLEENLIETNYIEMVEKLNNDYSEIYVQKIDGANAIKRKTGAIDSFTPILVERFKEVLLSSKIVLAQMKAPKDFSIKLINFCYENNITIIITPCRPLKLVISEKENLELLDKISYITLNQEECEIIFGTKNLEACVKKYPNKLIVTLGIEGVMYHDGKSVQVVPAIKSIIAKDSTGAGDTFCGNFASCLVKGKSLRQAIEKAQFASQMQIQVKGAQQGMPKLESLEKYIAKMKTPLCEN